jgi:hypothetical protein
MYCASAVVVVVVLFASVRESLLSLVPLVIYVDIHNYNSLDTAARAQLSTRRFRMCCS